MWLKNMAFNYFSYLVFLKIIFNHIVAHSNIEPQNNKKELFEI